MSYQTSRGPVQPHPVRQHLKTWCKSQHQHFQISEPKTTKHSQQLSIQTGEKKTTQPSTKGTNKPNETSNHSGTSTSICGHSEGTKEQKPQYSSNPPQPASSATLNQSKKQKKNWIQASLHIRQQTIAFRIPETTRDPGSLQMQPHEKATASRQPIPPSTTLTHWSLEPRAYE
ncbi:hypothetical protein Nepgr_015840 [Nepenthes gracilis]|uniref:Uncharacterized protein n=1 Tax=Nepenthes gracilis TaxID=150966 RepID=A0AAD3SNH8_NEPGR|nr:hypothetical protein Nepgr_015840 [Nepenthes gracilis]